MWGQRDLANRMVSVSVLAASFPVLVSAGGGGGPNIFMLLQYYLDCWQFWLMLAGMLFYGLIIDRAQALIIYLAEGNRCNTMIVNRVISEFMVFGVVGITLFLISTLAQPPVKTNAQLTFCDFLVSFAACFLILMGGIYNLIRLGIDAHLSTTSKQLTEDPDLNETDDLPHLCGWTPMNKSMQRQFMAVNKLDVNTFSWNLYFQEALASQICELININWKTWLITSLMAAPVAIYKHGTPTKYPAVDADPYTSTGRLLGASDTSYPDPKDDYFYGWATVTCLFAVITLLLWLFTRKLRKDLYEALKDDQGASSSDEGDDTTVNFEQVEEKMKTWSQRIPFALQVMAVLQCFTLGMYLMHLLYNLQFASVKVQSIFNTVVVLANVLSLLVFGPLALIELTSVQCYADPDPDVKASIISECGQAWNDLANIRQQIESKARLEGCTAPTGEQSPQAWAMRELLEANGGGDDTIMRHDFQGCLAAIGIMLTGVRAVHVFDLVAEDPCNRVSKSSTTTFGSIKNRLEDLVKQVSIESVVNMVFVTHEDRCHAVHNGELH